MLKYNKKGEGPTSTGEVGNTPLDKMKEKPISISGLTVEEKIEVLQFYWLAFLREEHHRSDPIFTSKHFGLILDELDKPTLCFSVSDINFMNKEVVASPHLFIEKILITTEKAEEVNGYFVSVSFISPYEAKKHLKKRRSQGWNQIQKKAA